MIDFLDFESARAGERYVAFLNSLRGLYERSFYRAPHDIEAIENVAKDGSAVAENFVAAEVKRLDEQLDQAKAYGIARIREAIEGSQGAPLPEGEDYSEELLAWFRRELAMQAFRDVNTLAFTRRSHALQNAASGRMRTYAVNKVDFLFTDRSGRKYPAQKFYRNLYRQTLLVFAVESAASDAISFGYDKVFIDHHDKNKTYIGVPITLTGNADMLSLHDVRDDVFHPNSTAFLTVKQS